MGKLSGFKQVKDALINTVLGPARGGLDGGMQTLDRRLGLSSTDTAEPSRTTPTAFTVHPTAAMARSIYYAPDMDGQADPGEVVWMWAPAGTPHHLPQERAIVIVGRTKFNLLGLLISDCPRHEEEDNWMDIGSGAWDTAGQQAWVRLDRIVEVNESGIRRQGAIIPRRRFDRIASRLTADYGWS